MQMHFLSLFLTILGSSFGDIVPSNGIIHNETIQRPSGILLFDDGDSSIISLKTNTGETKPFYDLKNSDRVHWICTVRPTQSLVFQRSKVTEGRIVLLDIPKNQISDLWETSPLSFLSFNTATHDFAYVKGQQLILRNFLKPDKEDVLISENVRGPISWNPDGSMLVFVNNLNEIHITNIKDHLSTRIITNSGWPAWSPNGQTIAYRSNQDLLLYDVNQHTTSVLTQTEQHCPRDTMNWGQLSWSPDGVWIAYAEGYSYLKRVEGVIYLIHVPSRRKLEVARFVPCPIGALAWWQYDSEICSPKVGD